MDTHSLRTLLRILYEGYISTSTYSYTWAMYTSTYTREYTGRRLVSSACYTLAGFSPFFTPSPAALSSFQSA